jgi:hypothetical protein
VRTCSQLRFSGKAIASLPFGPLRSAVENELNYQRGFPLDVANAIRRRLRTSGLVLYKRNHKGHTCVCAVRRKLRTTKTVFADSIQRVLDFIEKHPNTKILDLPAKFLAPVVPPLEDLPDAPQETTAPEATAPIATAPTPEQTATDAAPVAEATAPVAPETADAPAPATAPEATTAPTPEATPEPPPAKVAPATAPVLDINNPAVRELFNTVRWLVSEGYLTEFSDGRLFAPPVASEAQAKAAETEDDSARNDTDASESSDSPPSDTSVPDDAPDLSVPSETE